MLAVWAFSLDVGRGGYPRTRRGKLPITRRAPIFAWAPLASRVVPRRSGEPSSALVPRRAAHVAAPAARVMLGAWLALTLALAARTFAVLLLFALSPFLRVWTMSAARALASLAPQSDPRRRGGDARRLANPSRHALVASPRRSPRLARARATAAASGGGPDPDPARLGLHPRSTLALDGPASARRGARPDSSSSSTVSAAPRRISPAWSATSSSARVAKASPRSCSNPGATSSRVPSTACQPARRASPTRSAPSSPPIPPSSTSPWWVTLSVVYTRATPPRFSSTCARARSRASDRMRFSRRRRRTSAWVPSGTSVCSRRRCARSSAPRSARRRGS